MNEGNILRRNNKFRFLSELIRYILSDILSLFFTKKLNKSIKQISNIFYKTSKNIISFFEFSFYAKNQINNTSLVFTIIFSLFCLVSTLHGAIIPDNTSYGTMSNVSTKTIAHTTPSGSNRLMIVGVSAQQPGASVSSVTYNGVALTKLGNVSNASQSRIEIWYLKSPAVGTFNVVLTNSQSENAIVGVKTFSGVNLTTTFGTLATSTGNSASAFVTATSATDELVYAVVGFNNGSTNQTPGSGQTEYYDQTINSSICGAGSSKAGASSVTMSWTSTSSPWSIGAVSIKPAASIFPGGVSGASVWLKADLGVTTGATMTWADQSGNGRNGTQATAANQPTLNSSVFNFNPALNFDGATDFLSVQNLSGLPTGTSQVQVFSVANNLNTAGGWGHIFTYGSTATSQLFGISKNTGNANAAATFFTNDAISSLLEYANGQPALTESKYTGTQGIISSFGVQRGTITFTGAKTVSTGFVGKANDGAFWNGNIPEVVLFPTNLTTLQTNQVNSYLALKYGLTLSQTTAQNYTASDGTTIYWNGTSNSGYKNNIAGIVRDDLSALYQKQSKSVNTGLQLVIGNGNLISATNAANTSTIAADKSTLVWGDNAASVSTWTSTGSPSTSRQIVSRTWKVQETGSIGSVKIQIADNSGTNGLPSEVNTIYLLTDADGNFSAGATEVVMTLNGTNWEANVDLTNGQFFTFATDIQRAPGGVVTNNTLWLKADAGTSSTSDGAAVNTWTNSASGAQVSTAAVGFRPIFKVTSSNLNFNPVLDFGGDDDYFAGTSNFGVTGTSLFTAFAVSRRATDNTSDMFFGGNANSNNNFGFSIQAGDQAVIEANNYGKKIGSNSTSLSNVGVIKAVKRSASNTWQLYHNGVTDGTSGTITGGPSGNFAGTLATTNLNFGAGKGTQDYFDGDISEIIIHSGALTDTEIHRIESYLALKYGITLDQSVAQNYLASDGTTIFWNGTTNSNHKNNIAGIARDDSSDLNQKQSGSVNSGVQVVIGNGNTIAISNAANTNNFSNDKSALVWGDNGGDVSTWTIAGSPSSLRQIVSRTWKVQETGTIGSVKIQVGDNSGSNGLPSEENTVYLLIDNDGDFSSGATEIAMTLNGTKWEANADLSNGQFFTFATQVQIAPGGVPGALVWLKSTSGTSTTTNGSGISTWTNQMGGGNAVQPTSINQPTFQTSVSDVINFNPIVRFNSATSQSFNLSANIFGDGTTRTAANFFTVLKNNDLAQYNGLWYEVLDGNNRILQHLPWSSSGLYWDAGSTSLTERLSVSNSYINNTSPLMWSFLAQNTSQSIKQDGQTIGTNSGANITYGFTNSVKYLGRSDGGYFGGDMGEIIGYGTALTTTQIQQIESYLAIKYGKTINQNTPVNYLASDGNTIFWNATNNSIYKNNIAGIARDDVSGLLQKQSRSVNTGFQVTIGNGNSILATNALNSSSISTDKSALVWGDNAGSVSAWSSNGAPTGWQLIERKWKIQETGSIGSVKIQIADNSGTNGLPPEIFTVFLLVDADGDFTSGATQVAMTLNGTNWEGNVDFSDGQYFTFATLMLTTNVTNVLCHGNTTGAIDLVVAGGSGYTYDWSNDGPETPDNDTQDLSNLAAGSYVVTVTDGSGATATATATVTQPGAAITLSSVVTNVSTTGANNGAINISVAGGSPDYSYLWSNGATTKNITGIAAGNFTVTVTDINSCTGSFTMTVGTNSNSTVVNKQLYLSDGLSLDRVNPAATPFDNTTAVTANLSSSVTGVAIDAISTVTYVSGSSTSLAHTVGTSDNRLLLVGISTRDRSVTSVTYSGTPMILVGTINNGIDARITIYRLINPPSGTANVVVNFSGSTSKGAVISATSFRGVDQTDPLRTFNSAIGTSTTPSVSISSVAGDLVYDVLSKRNTGTSAPGSSQTERLDLSSGEIRGAGSTAPATTTSTTMSWTISSAKWAIGGVAIKPATVISNVTFTQFPVMCSPLTIKASNTISFNAYLAIISGTMPANPNITATIKHGATNIITLTNPTYNSGTGMLTWTGTRGTDITVPAGSAISVEITTAQGGVSFQVRHDSQSYPSKITLPVSTFINVNTLRLHDASYPNGNLLTDVSNTGNTYLRVSVSDPFGTSDITGVNLTFTKPNTSTFTQNLGEPQVVNTAGCLKTYQYVWADPTDLGTWNIQAVANEGTEGVTHSSSLSVEVVTPPPPVGQTKFLYLSDPSQALDRIDPVSVGDGTTAQTATLSSSGTTTATFVQNPALCSGLTLPDGGVVGIKTYATVISGSPATITVAATTSGSSASVASGGTLSFSHTPGTGPNRLLLVSVAVGNTGVSDEAAPGTVTSVTFGGTAMTLVSSVYSGYATRSYIYRLVNPTASPSANVVITIGTKTSGVIASATTFNNVHQSTPLGTGQTFTSSGSDYFITGTVTSAPDELVYSTVSVDEYTGVQQGITTSSGQSQLWNNSGFNYVSGASSTKDGAASVSLRYDFLDYEDGCIAAVSIKPATSGTMSSTPNITAVLKYGATTFATLTNPAYNSSTGLITWSGTLNSDINIPAGQAISLVVTTAEPVVTFKLDFDSQTKPSRIEIPVISSINITSLAMYNAAYPGGSVITTANKASTVYVRATVTSPFGTSDITGMNIGISPLGTSNAATSVATSGCSRTYQYVWNSPNASGDYTIMATAKEGYENTVVDEENLNFSLCPLTLNPTIASAPTCSVPDAGNIALNISGGGGPYTWNWSRVSPAATGTGTGDHIPDLIFGTYNITVTAAGGCSGTGSITLLQPVGPTIVSTVTNTGTLCYDGSIELVLTGTSGFYSSFWSDGVYTHDRNNLVPGMYSVTVTDIENGCTAQASMEILLGSPIQSTVFALNPDCVGGSGGSLNISPTGGTGIYTYLWSDGATTEDRASLNSGSYRVTVTDSGGCTASFQYVLSEPQSISLNHVKTDVTCTSNGAINITVGGGVLPFKYNWQDLADIFDPEDRSGLTPGTYTVTVTDTRGCTATSSIVLMTPECDVEANSVCISTTADIFKVDPDPDVTSYVWRVTQGGVISSGQGTPSITVNWSGSSIGNGQVCVYTTNNCGESREICTSVYIKSVNATAEIISPSCLGSNISFIGGGGSAYAWSGPNGFVSSLQNPSINNAVIQNAGVYVVTVTNENGCTASASVILTLSSGPVLSVSSLPTSACGESTGSIDLTVSGGISPYEYEWSNGAVTQDITDVGFGSFKVTVTDNSGCSSVTSKDVANVEGLNISISKTNVMCYDGNDGAANLTLTGGSGNYSFQWSHGATSQNVTALRAGTYFVTVADVEEGCSGVETITITQPERLRHDFAVSNIDQYGQNSGEIDLIVSGGVPNYGYKWSDLPGTTFDDPEDRSGLSAGMYVVSIADANNCVALRAVEINQPNGPLMVNVIAGDVTCNGLSNGYIDLSVTGGTSPYSFLWSGAQTTEDIKNIPPGTYTVTVTDARSITVIDTFEVGQPEILVANINKVDLSCFNDMSGVLDVSVSGGTAPFNYLWSTGAQTEDVNGLSAGMYTVSVQDINRCQTQLSEQLDQPLPISIGVAVDPVDCFGTNTGNINLTISGGTGNYSFSWSNGATTKDLLNISSGNYTITVTDESLCSKTTFVTIGNSNPLTSTAFVSSLSCNDIVNGYINLTVSGGTEPYTYRWSDYSVTEDIDNLSPGTYTVTVTDANLCEHTAEYTVNQPEPIVVNAAAIYPDCFGNNQAGINITHLGGISPYTYAWSNGASTQNVSNLSDGIYFVTVTDNVGCTGTSIALITQPSNLVLTGVGIPNCPGQANGALTLYMNGGTEPYNYVWSDAGPNDFMRTGLNTGIYSVTVTDANGCTSAEDFAIEPLSVQFFNVLPSCAIDQETGNLYVKENGEIYAKVSGGLPPYQFLWSTGDSTSFISNLALGIYSVTVEANGCYISDQSYLTGNACIPPVAADDFYITEMNVPVSGNLAINDYDPNTEYPLTFLPLGHIDEEVGIISWDSTFNGAFNFTPYHGYFGTFSIRYQICDTLNLCDIGNLTIRVEKPVIGLAKTISNGPINNEDGTFSLSYSLLVENKSLFTLSSVQVEEDLNATFAGSISYSVNSVTSTLFNINSGFNGSGDKNLLTGSGSLAPLASGTILINLTLTPGQTRGPYINTALVTAISPEGIQYSDVSQNGILTDPDNDGDPTNNNEPTPLLFCPAANITGPSVICIGATTTLSPTSGGTWVSSDPSIATVSSNGVVTALTEGMVTFVFSQPGCSSEPSNPVTIVGKQAIVTGSTSICPGTTTTLIPASGGVWSSSNPSVAVVNNSGIVTGLSTGSATFIFTETSTGCTSPPSEVVQVSLNPVVSITGSKSICVGNTTQLSPSSGGSWVSSSPAIASVNNQGLVTGISQGIVTFIFTQSSGCVSNPTSPLTVNGRPNVFLSGDPEICIGTTTTFLPSAGGTWTSSNPSVATISNSGVVTGISAGSVNFTFIQTSGSCASEPTQDIIVKSKPMVQITGLDDICIGMSTTLSPVSGGTWTSNNPSVASVSNAGVVFGISPGQATFSFRSGETQCLSDPTSPLTVNDRPTINYTGSYTICVGSNITLSSQGSGIWFSSNQSVAQITSGGLVTAIAPGTVTFTFTSSVTGCASNPTSAFTILGRPTVSISGQASICVGSTTNLTPSSGGTWSSSNSGIATVNNSGVVTGVSLGSAFFYFTETSSGCISNATLPITVNGRPEVAITGPSIICVGATTTLSPTTGGSWSSSNPMVATVSGSGVVTGISNGVANMIFTSQLGCASITNLQINVNGGPPVTLNGPSSICIGTTTSLLPSSGGVWVSNNPSIASISNAGIITGIAPGTATFTFTDSFTGCVSAPSTLITVNNNPGGNISGPATICAGSATTLTPTVGGSWASLNPSVASVSNSGLVQGISAGTSSFIFTSSSTGCSSLPTGLVTVNPRPTSEITGNNPICIGSTTTLSPTTGGTWTSTNPTVAQVTNAGIVTGMNIGTVRFIFISSATGCVSPQSSLLIVQAKPVATISGTVAICEGATTSLTPSSGGLWTSSNTNVATISNTGIVTGISAGTATFTFTDSASGCTSGASEPITVNSAPEISITGPEQICVGFTTTLSPSAGGIWLSNHPDIAIVNASGVVTGLREGFATFSYQDGSNDCNVILVSDTILVKDCFEPDFNITSVNVSVNGNVNTNDMVPLGTVYGTVPLLIDKPEGSTASITMGTSGLYTFVANLPGEYIYHVPVCASDLYQNCPFSTLKILVLDVESLEKTPIANMDHGYTYTNVNPALSGNPVTLKTLSNDYCIYASGCNLDPLSVVIVTAPEHGITTISANGNITYTPDPGFSGKEVYIYKVCIENEPLNCDTALQIVQVMDVRSKMGNFTLAEDDYFTTYQETTISGNVKINDLDPEGDTQIVTSNGSTLTPVSIPGGKYFIDNSGNFTFIPDKGFSGPTSFIYTTCDDNESSVCAQATVHIFVLKDLSISIRVYLEGAIINNGNAKSGDNRHLMRDNLRMSPFTGQSFIPVQDPYRYPTEYINIVNKFKKVGAGTLSRFHVIADPGTVFGVTGQNAIVDWVFVELRSKNDAAQIVASRSGLLQRDGDVVDTDGISPLAFPQVAPDSFYIVIRHRNHLGAMSLIESSKDLIDFTSLQTPIYTLGLVQSSGLNYTGYSMKENQLLGYRALWAGNFDADGKLKFVNPNDDQNILFFDVLVYPNNTNSASNYNFGIGYLQGDFDMNSKAKYDNPNDDKNLLFSQLLLFPLNTSILSNYNYFIQQVPESR